MPLPDLSSKTCLVTGANAGLGLATARSLAAAGATTLLLCRDRARGEAALAEVREAAAHDRVEVIVADLEDLDSLREAAKRVEASHPRLDILVNNAGVFLKDKAHTPAGLERSIAINHLGPFVLTQELLPLLKRAAPSRIVGVASDAHRAGKLDWEDLQWQGSWSVFGAYARSKLMNVLFTRELARRLEGSGVTATCVHPGFVATNIGERGLGPVWRTLGKLVRVFGKDADSAAETQLWAATSPEVEGQSGRYYVKCNEVQPSALALDDDAARRLWELSETWAGL
jgi:NAD(P)-dependent dehydrogenase (short-subunit alcohol dehydrogenase family)